MNKKTWRIIGRFALLILIQLLVLNQVYLGSYVMPMLYLLAILMLPTDTKRIPLLLIAFGTGLLLDIMNNMLGFHALACTVVAMMRILFADRILTRGEPVTISIPSIFSVSPSILSAICSFFWPPSIWCSSPSNYSDSTVSAASLSPPLPARWSQPCWQCSISSFS